MKSAHWLQKSHLFRADEFICSSCESKTDKPYKICPCCGSPMKKTKFEASWINEAE